ncbi:uncharacterized protein TNCV_4835331 [Trichonephila clavipes]|nr:uncharacterized protein TNCV_4835331 [Trichonephila clavipes]
MGDETYIPFFDVPTHRESKVWIFEDDPTSTTVNEKSNVCRFFRSTGLVKGIKLEMQKTVTAKCRQSFRNSKEMNVRRLMLHHETRELLHTAGLTVEFIKQKQIKVIEYPPFSPDLTMCV